LRGVDAVIDLHNFDMLTSIMGVVVTSSDKQLHQKNMNLMNAFSPKQVWLLNPLGEENRFSGCLGVALNQLGIPNIAVELNHPKIISEEQVAQCVKGVLRVLSSLKILDFDGAFDAIDKPFPVFARSVLTAHCSGIFHAKVQLGDVILPGQSIGTMTLVPEFERYDLFSHHEGEVMQVLKDGFVHPGQELMAIGRMVHHD